MIRQYKEDFRKVLCRLSKVIQSFTPTSRHLSSLKTLTLVLMHFQSLFSQAGFVSNELVIAYRYR